MLLRPTDLAYPSRLANLDPAPELTTSGPLDHKGLAVAIVGSRAPTPEAADFTRDLASRLARANVVVISGGAIGIDTAAHEGALDAGVTWCVAPSGRLRPYPAENAPLFDRIAASERSRMIWPFADARSKSAETPKERNRVLVALARVVVVVQAHLKSGSRNAARHARAMGRPLFVVPAAPWMAGSFGGSLLEIARGALPLCHPDQLFRFLGLPPSDGRARWPEPVARTVELADRTLFERPRDRPPRPPRFSEEETAIFSALCTTIQHTDEVVAKTGLPTRAVVTALLTLSLKDVVVEGPDGFYRRREVP